MRQVQLQEQKGGCIASLINCAAYFVQALSSLSPGTFSQWLALKTTILVTATGSLWPERRGRLGRKQAQQRGHWCAEAAECVPAEEN